MRNNMFKKLIDKLFCCHEWQELKRLRYFFDDDDDLPYTITYVYKCNKCGKIKKVKA